MNGRIAYSTERYSIAGFIKNAFNKFYNVYGINTESFGSDFFVPGPPRTYGVEATFRF